MASTKNNRLKFSLITLDIKAAEKIEEESKSVSVSASKNCTDYFFLDKDN